MKQNLLFSGFFVFILSLISNIEAQKLTGYPPVDQPPPILPKFTSLVNLSKIPKAPIRKEPSNPCDGTKDPFCYWSCTGCLRKDDISTCPNQKDWGITYDDGPSEFTPKVLDHLKAKGVKATFFVVGSRIIENPAILKRIHEEGHQIGIHTWSHTPLTTQSNEEVIAELEWTHQAIKEVTGVSPTTMRPPQGDFDDRIRFIANSLGYKAVIWDLDPNDWMITTDPKYDINWIDGNFTEWVKLKSKTGHISLEHDLYQQTVSKAPEAINIVMNAKFNIKTIASCVNQPAFVGDNSSNTTTTAPVTTSSLASVTTSKLAPVYSSPSSSAPVSVKQSKSPSVQSYTQQQVAQTSSTGKTVPTENQSSGSFSAANSLTVDSVVGFSITATMVMISLHFV